MDLTYLSNSDYLRVCADLWRTFNADYFAGKLKRCPYFKIFNDERYQGWHCPNTGAKRTTIALNRKHYTNEAATLCEILLHEMVHQEQHEHTSTRIQNGIHDAFFRRRAVEIQQQTGYNIASMLPIKG